jgi:hypothetical protein
MASSDPQTSGDLNDMAAEGTKSQMTPGNGISSPKLPGQTNSMRQIPAAVENNRVHYGVNEPFTKGHDGADKHRR